MISECRNPPCEPYGWRDSTDATVLRAARQYFIARVERAYLECREDDCRRYHADLLDAEHRLRMASRAR